MQYRPFGKLEPEVSALGVGCMRFPTTEDGRIDEAPSTQMLHHAIDHGVNYLDSGYFYHGGESEPFLGRALQGGYRERVRLATKLPARAVETHSDFDRILNTQLSRLQTEHIDVYLLHGLRRSRWDHLYPMGILDWAEGAKRDGCIGAFGFSFHDTFEVLKEIIDACEGWDVCQVQYNYMNEAFQAGTRGVRYAASKGLAVVVMEPILGGRLASPPASVQRLWDQAERRRSPVEWALQWLWDQPEVSVVLSGMSTLQQVKQNVASADRSGVATLSGPELELIGEVRDAYRSLFAAPCTGCGYCMPCPNSVDIPRIFTMVNMGIMYDDMENQRSRYRRMLSEGSDWTLADSCVQCGECESKCPQNIAISEWMPYIHEVLAGGRPYCPKDHPQ